METLEQKRAAAAAQPGTRYDARTNKFFSRIMVRGVRSYLGYFITAEEAGDAYRVARANEPIFRQRENHIVAGDAFQCMLEDETFRDKKGFLIPGVAFFVIDNGQNFELDRVMHRKAQPGAGRKRWVWWIWKAPCILCGASFETMIRVGVKHIHGITRTCEVHRGLRGEPWSLVPEHDRLPAVLRPKPVTDLV